MQKASVFHPCRSAQKCGTCQASAGALYLLQQGPARQQAQRSTLRPGRRAHATTHRAARPVLQMWRSGGTSERPCRPQDSNQSRCGTRMIVFGQQKGQGGLFLHGAFARLHRKFVCAQAVMVRENASNAADMCKLTNCGGAITYVQILPKAQHYDLFRLQPCLPFAASPAHIAQLQTPAM